MSTRENIRLIARTSLRDGQTEVCCAFVILLVLSSCDITIYLIKNASIHNNLMKDTQLR